jgi:acyl-[acyl-carrier-protein]-phospholipid O-acyltransferase/long-chain-fatty-acid--[acyl-carrier-protein] ligase
MTQDGRVAGTFNAEMTRGGGRPQSPAGGGVQPGPHDGGGLWTRSFSALLVTQFLVALNDNIFRWLIIPIGTHALDKATILGIGGFCFLLPFLVLAGPAGYLADRFSKRSVMIGCKAAEIVIMALGIAVILSGNIWLMLAVLFLMGAQSALFSPSKFGSIPEIVRPEFISKANGLVGMTTMVACILGTWIGPVLYVLTTPLAVQLGQSAAIGPGQARWWISASVLIGVAIAGWLASLLIGRLPPAAPERRFPRNPAGQVARDLGALIARRPLMWAALASTFFWSLGVLAQTNVYHFAVPELVGAAGKDMVGPMLAVLTLGIGLGCFAAGLLSAGKVELGIVPFGALGIAAMGIVLSQTPQGVGNWNSSPYFLACLFLFLLGLAAGLYDIPLLSFLQERSPADERGRILAAYNFLAYTGMISASGLFLLLAGEQALGLAGRDVWLLAGLGTLPVCAAIVYAVFTPMARVLVRMIVRILYQVTVRGTEHIPAKGGALLVANHVTWLDTVFLLLHSPRSIRFLAHADYIKGPFGRLARDYQAIPIRPGRKSMVESLRAARQALGEGSLVCVFPEGGLSRTGQLQGFRRGFLSILRDTGAPVIPVHLGGLWGSVFSFERGKFFWKWPRRLPYPVSLVFGSPMHHLTDPQQVRLAIEELGYQTMQKGKRGSLIPPRAMLRACRRNLFRVKAADSTGAVLTGGSLLMRALVLRRLLRRELLEDDESTVGVMLPPSVAGLVINAALALDRRVAVNLNYTVSSEIMNECIKIAGIRRVLTSRKVMEKFDFQLDAEVVFLEDFRERVRRSDKAAAAAAAWLLPAWILERMLGLTRIDPDDMLTVIFTSGSTGMPKGAILTHHNIGSNVDGFCQVLQISAKDVLLGILPFFHSFGYTVAIWTVLMLDPKCVYHYSPLEARPIGKLSRDHGVTILVATPTFLRSYIRRCDPGDFAKTEVVITGAEKLPREVAEAFHAKFGVLPVEGYGTTELSPVVSTNIPDTRLVSDFQQGNRIGSVGQPLPGISAKVVDLETGESLGTGKSGMLLVKGPNVMKGYLGQAELTAQVVRDGWYTTGDIAKMDEDGFLYITGRQSRFSKIAGEMVPHLRVEEVLSEVIGDDGEGEQRTVVTGVPDEKKGERLVVLHTNLDLAPDQICRRLAEAGVPPLWIPAQDSFLHVDEIPLLGTGKLDLKGVKDLALRLTGAKPPESPEESP